MRKLLLILLLLLPRTALAQPVYATSLWPCITLTTTTSTPSARVQGAISAGNSSTTNNAFSFSFASTVGIGNGVVGIISADTSGGALQTVTDDKGNSYTIVDKVTDVADAQSLQTFFNSSLQNQPKTLIFTFSASTVGIRVLMEENTGLGGIDQHAMQFQLNPGGSGPSSGTVTTTKANETVWGFTDNTDTSNPTYQAGATFTLVDQAAGAGNQALASEIRTSTPAGGIAATFTTTNGNQAYITAIMAFFQVTVSNASSCATPPPIIGSSFYFATNGNDSFSGMLPAPNAGNTDGPFRTPEQCKAAMDASITTKVCRARAGTYARTSILTLNQAESGQLWQYYEPDGYNTAIFDGGASSSTTGINGGVLISGGSNITWNGIQLQNFNAYGIAVHGGAAFESLFPSVPNVSNNTVKNSIIHHIYDNSITNTFNQGCIMIEGNATNTSVFNNVCHDSFDNGIRAGANDDGNTPSDNISGTDIENNVVYNIGGACAETAGIYTEDGTTTGTVLLGNQISGSGGGSANIKRINNIVWNYASTACDQGRGMYLDEGSSNQTITGNVIGPPGPGNNNGGGGLSCFFVSTGNNNKISNNICDLSTAVTITQSYLQFGASQVPMTGNTFQGNIMLSNFAGASQTNEFGVTGAAYISGVGAGGLNPTQPTIGGTGANQNIYFNKGGGATPTNGNGASDSNPLLASPGCTDTYVFNNAPNFTAIAKGWGPPSFVLPTISPAPSCP